jgi:hypothetical protein
LYVAATAIAAGIFVYQAYDTAASLSDRELGMRAEDLARAMVTDSAGRPRLELPSKLAAAYAAAPEGDLFAIRDTSKRDWHLENPEKQTLYVESKHQAARLP